MDAAKKKVLIIGGGIAGLSAGSYLARNGYDTEIFEMHALPGGLCTGWTRKGYTFDYCIHWLMGTKKNTGFDRIWDELGAFVNEDGSISAISNFDEFSRLHLSDGEVITMYGKLDKFQAELLRVAPEDAKEIKKLCGELRKLARVSMPGVIREEWNIWKYIAFGLKNLGPGRIMLKHMKTSVGDYAKRWKTPRMKELFTAFMPQDWSVLGMLFGLALQDSQSAGYPAGGSLVFAKNIARKYASFGGKIRYNSKVSSIILDGNSAAGVRLESGEEIFGDYIISAADGYSTLYTMLEGKYLPERVKKAYDTFPLFPSSVMVGLGIGRDLSSLPRASAIHLEEPIIFPDGTEHKFLAATIYHYDPSLAPPGKTMLTALFNTWDSAYWQKLAAEDPAAYKQTKEDIGAKVIDALDKHFGNIRSAVEVVDVSTPHSVIRYTGNWQGSFEGFAPTPKTFGAGLPKALKGLENFYMIGQWTTPGGGLPPAGKDGRDICMRLCKQDKKVFKSS